jgi:four helix bundle protein
MAFDAYDVSQAIIRELREIVPIVRKHDPKQADQIRRAGNAIVANVTEGRGRKGRDRTHHFTIAFSEAREVSAHLDSGVSWGYLDERRLKAVRELLDRERAMLWRLSRG